MLGDGTQIYAFRDPWLRLKEGFCVESALSNDHENEKVSEFFMPDLKRWDEQRVRNSFHQCDVNLILDTIIPQNQAQDRVAWAYSNNGKYSVKTGYAYWQDHYSQCTRLESSAGWSKIWRVEVPH